MNPRAAERRPHGSGRPAGARAGRGADGEEADGVRWSAVRLAVAGATVVLVLHVCDRVAEVTTRRPVARRRVRAPET
ncbi:hypothetical protein GCM10010195_20380 [Kitasatospora griseola]|nr:hypothetical protein GCM10010195_20380 [Kitasatospora griseola]